MKIVFDELTNSRWTFQIEKKTLKGRVVKLNPQKRFNLLIYTIVGRVIDNYKTLLYCEKLTRQSKTNSVFRTVIISFKSNKFPFDELETQKRKKQRYTVVYTKKKQKKTRHLYQQIFFDIEFITYYYISFEYYILYILYVYVCYFKILVFISSKCITQSENGK